MAYLGKSKSIKFEELDDPSERYELGEILGEGTCGIVYKATDKPTGKLVAVKVMENLAEIIEEIDAEYTVLKDLSKHDNLPDFYGIYWKKMESPEEDQLWFIMELCNAGTISEFAQKIAKSERKMQEDHIALILKEVINAMIHLHNNHVMHRDIKGSNIVVTESADIKLVDFGSSAHFQGNLGTQSKSIGTPHWMAPEVIACDQSPGATYDARCDVWSLGITAIELAMGEPPLSHVHPATALYQIAKCPPPSLSKKDERSEMLTDFVNECLVKNPDHRPIMAELLDHPFIQQIPENDYHLRTEIKMLLENLKESELETKPEVTTKCGYLKLNRKLKHQKIYMDDLATLENPNEDKVLENLYERFLQGKMCTYVGDILLSINPYHGSIAYEAAVGQKFRSKSRSDNDPHVFSVGDRAYQNMMHHKEYQCIILSGEKGSGKTVAGNQITSYLCQQRCINPGLGHKILQINPVLEAMGNALSDDHSNASRYVKCLDLTFGGTGHMSGAVVSTYQLEKGRVVTGSQNEANFHIFHYLCDGISEDNLEKYCLEKNGGEFYRYLNGRQNGDPEVNAEKFKNFQESLAILGFEDEEVEGLFSVLSAILNIGQLQFSGDNIAQLTNPEVLSKVAKLLGLEESILGRTLVTGTEFVRGETVVRDLCPDDACGRCDSLARALYSRLFDWLVDSINNLLSFTRLVYGDPFCITILDVFGWENREHNSLEQMFINITNEQLHYHFNQHIFTWEMQEYSTEGVNVEPVNYFDNRNVLEMFLQKPGGILTLLDEETRKRDGTDQEFVENLNNNIQKKNYLKSNDNNFGFTIEHYSCKVTYDATDFLSKNSDIIAVDLVETLRNSSSKVVEMMFRNPLSRAGNLCIERRVLKDEQGNPKKIATMKRLAAKKHNTLSQGQFSQSRSQQTLSVYFRHALMEMLHRMVSGSPHFIQCIRPNDNYSSNVFDRYKVQQQVKSQNILELIKIRQQGYSHRIAFNEFLRRYQFLAFDFDEEVELTQENCRLLLIRLKLDGWTLGNTKVLLKYYVEEYLSRLYETEVKKIVKVQAMVRRMLAKRKKEKGVLKPASPTDLDSLLKEYYYEDSDSEEEYQTQAAILIQKTFRGYKVRRNLPYRPKCDLKLVGGSVLRKYFKRWRHKTLYQLLTQYQANKYQILINFSQQVHLYNQEFHFKMRSVCRNINLKNLTVRNRDDYPWMTERATVTPLSTNQFEFLDTSYMCDPQWKSKVNESDETEPEEEEWDAPLRKLIPIPKSGVVPKPSCSTNQSTDPVPSKLSPKHPTAMTQPESQGSEANFNFSENLKKFKTTDQSPQRNGLTESRSKCQQLVRDDEDIDNPYDFRKLLRKTNNPIIEMEQKAAQAQQNLALHDMDAPFNFQGMLRKTSFSNRPSMKRREEDRFVETPTTSEKDHKRPEISLNEGCSFESTESTSPAEQRPQLGREESYFAEDEDEEMIYEMKHEILPGLFVIGNVADL